MTRPKPCARAAGHGKVGDRAEILVPRHGPWRIEVKDRYDARDALSTPMVAASSPADLDHVPGHGVPGAHGLKPGGGRGRPLK
ncbi:hypothetical protein GCM10010260_02300 [Streptomyces filipinensis]|uniref:Uncharacterized protein n=1 Tax=Streptomyces filipinensis TaxID=66887 RepID=A0A918I6C8_9ACTN|nr:hypothetical protein [Streptomyces filipinensis]GGU74026.1 hypothetical protein GCM10010260_02300 [Streptomyces filipinensis]